MRIFSELMVLSARSLFSEPLYDLKYAIILTAFCSLVLASCSATGPIYRAVDVKNDKSVIYIYRPHTLAMSGRTAYFELDGEPVAKLNDRGYTYLVVDPGVYTIRQNWTKWMFDESELQEYLEIPVEALKGGSAYIELKAKSYSKVSEIVVEWRLRRVDESEGKITISDCHYQKPITETVAN